VLINLSDFSDHLFAYSFVIFDFFVLTHFLLNFHDDVRMEKEILTASFFDALNQRMIHKLFDSLSPFAVPLRKYLAHHLGLKTVWQ